MYHDILPPQAVKRLNKLVCCLIEIINIIMKHDDQKLCWEERIYLACISRAPESQFIEGSQGRKSSWVVTWR